MPGIGSEEALRLIESYGSEAAGLFGRAAALKYEFSKDRAFLCAIMNAKSGGCAMDCAFCAQSARNPSGVRTSPLADAERIFAAAEKAQASGARRFSIVASGRSTSSKPEIETLAVAIAGIAGQLQIKPDASLGILPLDALERLRDAGLDRYHHNIETAPSFYPSICTTRKIEESFATIENARKAGLSVCCGGIFGLGETSAQRVELLETVRNLDPDSVPMNFYVPVEGARIAAGGDLTPMECLKIVAVARLMMPRKEIRICAGRARHLGSLKAAVFLAGADGLMIGDFLTTPGESVSEDLKAVRDAGLRP